MKNILKGMIIAFLIMYIVSPVDACPGPIDDLILLLIWLGSEGAVEEIGE